MQMNLWEDPRGVPVIGCKVPGTPVFMRWHGAGKVVSKTLLADVEDMDERE